MKRLVRAKRGVNIGKLYGVAKSICSMICIGSLCPCFAKGLGLHNIYVQHFAKIGY